MAKQLFVASSQTNRQATALVGTGTTGFDGGSIIVYDGTRPTNADTAITTQNALVTFPLTDAGITFDVTNDVDGEGSIITISNIPDAVASANGTAEWFRVISDSGTETICDGTVGVVGGAGFDLELNSTTITSGANVEITSFTYIVPTGYVAP